LHYIVVCCIISLQTLVTSYKGGENINGRS